MNTAWKAYGVSKKAYGSCLEDLWGSLHVCRLLFWFDGHSFDYCNKNHKYKKQRKRLHSAGILLRF